MPSKGTPGRNPGRRNAGRRDDRSPRPPDDGADRGWGSVARRGAASLRDGRGTGDPPRRDERADPDSDTPQRRQSASEAFRAARKRGNVPPWADAGDETWIDEGAVAQPERPRRSRGASPKPAGGANKAAKARRDRSRTAADRRGRGDERSRDDRSSEANNRERSSKRPPKRAADRTAALFTAAVGPRRAARLSTRLAEAAEAYQQERLDEAARILSGLAREAPNVAEVRELLGLTRYRQGRWRPAARELEHFRELTGSVEQNPVLADCYRALQRWSDVDALWEELREVSPAPEIMNEGRIVVAGSLADRGSLPDATRLLERGWRWPKRPQVHHLRRAYALADLYERGGDVPAARDLFARVAEVEPSLADAAARARSLR